MQPARSAAQAFVDHLNSVLNATVTDSRLSLLPLPYDEAAFEITRLVEAKAVPLELRGSDLRLFIRQTIVVDGRATVRPRATAIGCSGIPAGSPGSCAGSTFATRRDPTTPTRSGTCT
jgi:hypothetical protein